MKQKPLDAKELFIIKKMIGGDIDAFKYFFDTYYNDLCNFLNFYVKDETTSEEIVQEIFIHFWENRERLSVSLSVKSYLYAAVKNRGLNSIRNTRRRLEKLQSIPVGESIETDYSNFDSDVLRDMLTMAVARLPEKCRMIFKLKHDKQLTNKEIADCLQLSVKTVENQIAIGYKKLRTYLQPYREQIFFLFVISIL